MNEHNTIATTVERVYINRLIASSCCQPKILARFEHAEKSSAVANRKLTTSFLMSLIGLIRLSVAQKCKFIVLGMRLDFIRKNCNVSFTKLSRKS